MAFKTGRTTDRVGGRRRTAGNPDGHRLAAQLLRGIALSALVPTGQMFGICCAGCHMDKEPAIGDIRDGEVALRVRRGLREFCATESNRVLQRFIVDFCREWFRIDGTGRHLRGDVNRRDGNEIHRCAGNGMAGIRGRAANDKSTRSAHHPAREFISLLGCCGGWEYRRCDHCYGE